MMVTTLEDEIKSLRNAFTGNDPNINEIIKMSSPWTKDQEKIYANNSKSNLFFYIIKLFILNAKISKKKI